MNLQERGKEMAKKDFLNSLAQEVEDTKKGKEPSSKVTSFEEYDKQHQFVKDDNAILEDSLFEVEFIYNNIFCFNTFNTVYFFIFL